MFINANNVLTKLLSQSFHTKNLYKKWLKHWPGLFSSLQHFLNKNKIKMIFGVGGGTFGKKEIDI